MPGSQEAGGHGAMVAHLNMKLHCFGDALKAYLRLGDHLGAARCCAEAYAVRKGTAAELSRQAAAARAKAQVCSQPLGDNTTASVMFASIA